LDWIFVLACATVAYHGITFRDEEGERVTGHLVYGCIALFWAFWVLFKDIMGVI